MITAESKAKLFEKTYDAYLLAQSVTRVYGVESPPGQIVTGTCWKNT